MTTEKVPDPIRPIEEVYAFFVQGENQTQETIAAFRQNDLWVPMVTIDWQRVQKMMPYAQNVARLMKRPLRLAKFTMREDLELIEPDEVPGQGRVVDAETPPPKAGPSMPPPRSAPS